MVDKPRCQIKGCRESRVRLPSKKYLDHCGRHLTATEQVLLSNAAKWLYSLPLQEKIKEKE